MSAVNVLVLTEFVAVRVLVLTASRPLRFLASWIFRPLLPSFTTPMFLPLLISLSAVFSPPLMFKVPPSFVLTPPFISPVKVMPWLILLISVALMVTSLKLLMTFLALVLKPTVYSVPPVPFLLLRVICSSSSALLTLVFFLAISATAFSCATLTASVSALPAPRLMILRRMLLLPTDNAPSPVALALVRVAPVGV
ncbi:hypothetical protein AO375_1896 [Moraxella catarrhalis]|nr:hypothetical protein AO375_1896 [Moraxella catarrhalis]